MKFGSKTHHVQARKLFMVKVQALSIKVSQGAQRRKHFPESNWLTWDFGPLAFTVDARLVKF